MLADDHVSRQLQALLSPEFEIVATLEDGSGLIQAVEAYRPDVFVSDIAMPGLGGLAAARQVLARHPDARIVFVTVRNEPSVIRNAMSWGALGYVLECDIDDELATALRTVVEGGRYLSSNARVALESPKSATH
jgi:two-component system invasion response regulator UvrY